MSSRKLSRSFISPKRACVVCANNTVSQRREVTLTRSSENETQDKEKGISVLNRMIPFAQGWRRICCTTGEEMEIFISCDFSIDCQTLAYFRDSSGILSIPYYDHCKPVHTSIVTPRLIVFGPKRESRRSHQLIAARVSNVSFDRELGDLPQCVELKIP